MYIVAAYIALLLSLLLVGLFEYQEGCLSSSNCQIGEIRSSVVLNENSSKIQVIPFAFVNDSSYSSCWLDVSSDQTYVIGQHLDVLYLDDNDECSIRFLHYYNRSVTGLTCLSLFGFFVLCPLMCIYRCCQEAEKELQRDAAFWKEVGQNMA